ncbi:BrnA antitoxin family protein [Duganella hordei]|uniref:BrnA antitoxin family protein n=1 Tax=Duganella hordei TaxID=2865934 RepID=UPI0030E8EF2B
MRKEYDFSKGKRGAVISAPGKTRITIMLDDDVIQHFRDQAEAQGTGYQTMINAALRGAMNPPADRNKPITTAALRKVIREEISLLRQSEKPS